ncbi:MAG: hypothetical protein Q8S18_07785 [Bacteroidales bacterium]|nr:hypothetical protein [Bacteroidales bacterium]
MNKLRLFLTNPFVKIAGAKALVYGSLSMLLTAVLGWLFNTRFDGVLDIHFVQGFSFQLHLLDLVVSWLAITLVLFFTGLIAAGRGIRLIDIAGTMALARTPLMLAPIANTFSNSNIVSAYFLSYLSKDIEAVEPTIMQITGFVLSMILVISLTIYVIILSYRAFKVSTNLKGSKATVSFIIGLLIAEVLSKILIHYYVHPIL